MYYQEVSRRELRKAFERHGVSIMGEREVVALCDSIDPERRGRLHLSDIEDSLNRGKRTALAAASVGGVSSGGEVREETDSTVSERGYLGFKLEFHVRVYFPPVTIADGRVMLCAFDDRPRCHGGCLQATGANTGGSEPQNLGYGEILHIEQTVV